MSNLRLSNYKSNKFEVAQDCKSKKKCDINNFEVFVDFELIKKLFWGFSGKILTKSLQQPKHDMIKCMILQTLSLKIIPP